MNDKMKWYDSLSLRKIVKTSHILLWYELVMITQNITLRIKISIFSFFFDLTLQSAIKGARRAITYFAISREWVGSSMADE